MYQHTERSRQKLRDNINSVIKWVYRGDNLRDI